ncbi:hypothetical protein N2152v2_003131 [Parachlorella kessleri]
MPYFTVSSDPQRVQLHYELLVGEHAWDELIARDDRESSQPIAELELPTVGEKVPLARRWDLVETGALPASLDGKKSDTQQAAKWRDPVLFIPGLASKKTTEYFEQQVRHLTSLKDRCGSPIACVCVFDPRGVGRSSVPEGRQQYSTDLMCRDVIALLDHLGWTEQVHIVGQSLGALVALKLAGTAPQRIKSVTVMGAVLAGTDMLWSGWRNAPRFAAQFFFGGLRSKIRANLGMQYTQAYLSQPSGGGRTRLEAMAAATEATIQRKRGTVPKEQRQRNMAGRRGQMRACIWHRLTRKEVAAIAGSQHFRVLVLHGWHDRFISPSQAHKLGVVLRANMVTTEAAHAGIGIEAAALVNAMLETQILGGFPSPQLGGCEVPAGTMQAARGLAPETNTQQQQQQQQVYYLHARSDQGKLLKRVQTQPY